MIRVFQLMNIRPDRPIDEKHYSYLVFGCFDAMETWISGNQEETIQQVISDPFGNAIQMRKAVPDAECAYVIGFRDNGEREESFWSTPGFLFFSSIQLKMKDNIYKIANTIENKMEEKNKEVIVYFTLDQSSLLICLRTDRYDMGYETVMEYDDIVRDIDGQNEVLRGSTIVMFSKGWIPTGEEFINIQLFCIVNDRKPARALKTEIKNKCIGIEGVEIESFSLFGREDIMIQIRNLPIKTWLSLYDGPEQIISCNALARFGLEDLRTEVLENDGSN